ncbi:NAD(P)-binding protein [Melanomma pulvis-pyrius CBS 109.77]|uniref:NAD(P)-binding protein n=1 Tax=Melanomma pulvis-pyrius CBS 109.77 TaxID=1314802 RepID=A0A6A6XCB2_9PLEO|nr:NAD(P)-binding protein [Melanomma pulvis-pyrius CBS 109.77]
MSSSSTVLITGANRVYLANPNTTVIATVRDPLSAGSLHSLFKASGSRLVIIKLDVASTESIESGVVSLSSEHGINSLDVVIANAGIAGMTPKLAEAAISEIQDYINVNGYGQLELYKTVVPLLRKSESKAKFVYISSAGGSLTNMSNVVPLAAYGASKALGNFFMKWLSLETDDVLIWAQHPGMVATEMAKVGFEALKQQGIDMTAHIISVEQSTHGIKKVIDNATLENAQGKFLGPDGAELAW